MLILLIIVVVLMFGGFGGYRYGQSNGWGGPQYGGGFVGLILLVLLVLWLTGNLHGGMLR